MVIYSPSYKLRFPVLCPGDCVMMDACTLGILVVHEEDVASMSSKIKF